MNILFDIGHPAHVHLFRNFIFYLLANRHNVVITTRDKDVTHALLEYYKLNYLCLSKPRRGFIGMITELLERDKKIFSLHRKNRFDFAFGTSPSIGHLSLFTKVKSFNFNEDDDAVVPLYVATSYPFCNFIIVPSCLKFKYWKNKRIIHNSYHELAYLHPNNFIPDVKVLNKYGLCERKYVIARFSSLTAHHDKGVKGISKETWVEMEKVFAETKIIKSIENEISHQIEPWDMHHVLAFAKIVISDSQTMTAEAAVLGIPSIRINSFVGRIGYLNELEHRYNLTFGFLPSDKEKAIKVISEIFNTKDIHSEWAKKRDKMLSEKCDLNQWMIDFFNKLVNTSSN